MSLTRRVAHNTIIQFSGKLVSTLLGVITVAIMARYLGAAGYGQYSIIMAFLQFFGILIDLGLAVTVVRLIADPKYNQSKVFNNVFTLRIFSALIFLGIAPLIVLLFPYPGIVKIGVAVTTISFFFMALNQILIGLFQKELRLDKVTIAEVAGRTVLLGSVIAFAFLDYGLLYIMLAVVAGSFTNFLLTYIFAHRFVKIRLAFDFAIWAKTWQLTWPIAVSIAFNLVYFKADTIILSLFRSPAEVGIYGAPYRVLEILTNFVYMFMGMIFPILTLYWAQKSKDKFKDLFQKTFNFLVIMSVPMVFGTMFLAKEIMVLIAGQEFADSGLVLQIIIFATAIIFINALFGYSIVVINKQKQMVWGYIFVAIVSLVGYLILIPKYGYIGAASFTVVAEALILIFNGFVTIRTTKIFPSFMIFLKTIAASIIMSVFLYLLAGQNLILLIIGASVIYTLALYLFKGFSKEMVLDVIKIKKTS